ncbi:MAG: GDP-mannose 4,6-dehydratase [bacterium]
MKHLVTGGAGFIGSNTVGRLICEGNDVAVFDNMSRKGAAENVAWLRKQGNFRLYRDDVRDAGAVLKAVRREKPDVIIHLASQVAVTTSVKDPRADFEINAAGAFNVLEAVRNTNPAMILIFASTNKVYGGMENIKIVEKNGRYGYHDFPGGISESSTLDFHSPYGCSKGAADQYVRDYHRIYGIPSVVVRQSCIYGCRQFGIEDQGWVAWFTTAAILGKPINIYGDGKQTRDILYVDDLVDFYLKAIKKIKTTAGRIYNVGGGPDRQMSLLDLIVMIEKLLGRQIKVNYCEARPGDQKVYVSDITKAREDLNWRPKIGVKQGIAKLASWVVDNKKLLNDMF